jgi:hypothetical protein
MALPAVAPHAIGFADQLTRPPLAWGRRLSGGRPSVGTVDLLGGSYSVKMSSELSPGEIRAAAEVHRELGPEYSDAVVESFLERVDRRIAERVDREVAARVGTQVSAASRDELARPARASGRLILLTGVAIGIFVTGVPSVMVAASGGSVLQRDEMQLLVVLVVLLAVVAAIGAYVAMARETRNRGKSAKRV